MPSICKHLNKSDFISSKNHKDYTLQVQDPKLFFSAKRKWKVSLLASEGSLTIEASMVISLFLLSMVSILYIFVYYQTQVYMQGVLEKTTEDIMLLSSRTTDGDIINIFSDEYVKKIFWENADNKTIDKLSICNGSNGIIFESSDFVSDKGIIDICIRYSFKFPINITDKSLFTVVQHSKRMLYVGVDYSENDINQLVYVTVNGTVYHTDRYCTYLKPDINEVDICVLEQKRNSSGGKYYPCSKCTGDNMLLDTVYISKWGTSYHADRNCSSLARVIRTLSKVKAEEEGYRSCSKCGS